MLHADLISTLCRALVWTASWLVPARHRVRWQKEWLAEFAAMEHGSSRSHGGRRVKRSLLAFGDSLLLRWDESRSTPMHIAGQNTMLSDLIDDIRYGIRNLVRAPGFALVTIFTIALGIGATATIFSIVDAIMWRPMPYPEADRVVAVWPGRSFSPREVVRLETELASFTSIAAYVSTGATYPRDDGADYLFGTEASAAFFDVLGRPAALGRTFLRGEDKFGANDLVLLSHSFWAAETGSDPSVIGQRITLDQQPYTVIGVMPPELDVLERRAQFVKPLTMGPESPNYTGNWVNVLGRLAPGVTPDQAREELQTVFARWRQDYGYNTTFGNTATVVPIQEAVTTNVRQSMLLLMGAVLLTLLVATSNLASLLLNRALTRNQELAIRGALGARPGRILRQLLTESTVITSVGGALGVAFSVWGVHAIVGILPDSTPRIEYVALDARVLVFSVVLILLTGWAAGILPGLQLRHPAFSSLHAASRGASESRARRGLRSSLVVTELALSVVLLVGSGVLLRSLGAMNSVDTGLQPDRLLTFGLWPASEINARGPDGINQYYARVLDALSALPSVESSAAIHVLPVSGSGWNSSIEVEGRVTPPDAPYVGVWWRPITPGYFETTGMQLSTGRSFVPQDNAGSPWVGIINESMARRFWPTEDPIGKRFTYGLEGNEQLITVVGVVGNVKHLGITSETPPTLYRPFAQAGIRLNAMNVVGRWIVVRAVGNPEDVMDDVRRTVVATIPETPIVNLRPMTTVIQRSLADPRALSILLTLFAAAAVVLGAIGLYGVVAYTVRQRTRELGIRIALGASGGDVTASVIRQGLGYAAVGLPLGLLGAWVGSRAVADMLFQVSPTDPVTYVGVSLVLLVTVMAATIAPASQASKTDPLISLRAE